MSTLAKTSTGSGSARHRTHVRPRRSPRLRAAIFTLGAATATMVLVAPSAAAAVTTTTVSVQGTVATTCPVTLTANITPANAAGTVEFKDNNIVIAAAASVTNGTATANHTFGAAGAHVIEAKFTGAARSGFENSLGRVTVTVATGLNLGSICLPMG